MSSGENMELEGQDGKANHSITFQTHMLCFCFCSCFSSPVAARLHLSRFQTLALKSNTF